MTEPLPHLVLQELPDHHGRTVTVYEYAPGRYVWRVPASDWEWALGSIVQGRTRAYADVELWASATSPGIPEAAARLLERLARPGVG